MASLSSDLVLACGYTKHASCQPGNGVIPVFVAGVNEMSMTT